MRVRRPASSRVSTAGEAGPSLEVTTAPDKTKYGDAGSTVMRAGIPAAAAGMIVTATTLKFREAADEGARDAVDSFFWS